MMRRTILLIAALSVIPAAAQAQVEVGLDMGMVLSTGFEFSDNLTQLQIPTATARVGFAAGEMLSVETLVSLQYAKFGDDSGHSIVLIPGVNYGFGQSGGYVRGEVALDNSGSSGSDSETVWGVGGAVGLKKAIMGGPVSYRLEGGFLRWLENQDAGAEAYNQIRVLFGISAAVN